MRVKLPYGRGTIAGTITGPAALIRVLEKRPRPGKRPLALLKRSLLRPLGITLSGALRGRSRALVVVPDSTRNAHLKELLPALLSEIGKNGVRPDVIIATGLHAPESKKSIRALVGSKVADQYRVTSHAQKKRSMAFFGRTNGGLPVVLNSAVTRYDIVIPVGVIEPHLYAGYSGGVKTVAIGLAGEEFINATHHPRFLDDPRTALGRVNGNPFQNVLWEAVKKLPIDFCVNVVNAHDGSALDIVSGTPERAFQAGVRSAGSAYEVRVRSAADIVLCGVGYPKDVNIYQASRAMNYIANAGRSVLKKNGFLIIAAKCEDGAGNGLSERRCYRALVSMRSPCEYIRRVKKAGCLAGEHRAYMIARALRDVNVIVVGDGARALLGRTPIRSFSIIEDAVRYARRRVKKRPMIYVVPHALSTIATRG
ncbi:MAG: nickel-dependent lactate racemase [Candidatus Omnitrophota bacterium]